MAAHPKLFQDHVRRDQLFLGYRIALRPNAGHIHENHAQCFDVLILWHLVLPDGTAWSARLLFLGFFRGEAINFFSTSEG